MGGRKDRRRDRRKNKEIFSHSNHIKMDFKTFRTEFAKAHKGETSQVQTAYDIAKAAAPTATYLQWQAAAWKKQKNI